MTELALALVLLSAVAHASWNFIAKRASAGPAFNWLFDALSVLVCLPLGVAQIVLQPTHVGGIEAVFIVGSAVLHLAYFLLLGQGYRVGDLSLVYPLARGLGPMLSTAAAVLLLGERHGLAVAGRRRQRTASGGRGGDGGGSRGAGRGLAAYTHGSEDRFACALGDGDRVSARPRGAARRHFG